MTAEAGQSRASLDVPARRRRWFRIGLWLHRWSSLVATPFFLVLCITGSILIFHEEIDGALGYTPSLEGANATKDWGRFIDRVVAPGERPVAAFHDPKTPRRLTVFVAPRGFASLEASMPKVVDLATGRPAPMSDPEKTPTGIILKLHSKWFAGVAGELFGGVIALLVLVSLVTGVVVHAPFVRTMVFGMVRRGRGARIVNLDLHNLVGLAVLGWALVVTATGASLATGTVLLAIYQQGDLKTMSAAAGKSQTAGPVADVERVIAAASAAAPERRVDFVVYPDTDFSGKASFTIFAYGTQRYNERLFDVGIVDAHTAEVVALRPLPLYLAALVLAEPLHFGNYGGLALKLLWVANAFGALFITANGAWLWFRRGHRRGAVPALQVPA